jgi:CHAT domain-containing protein
MLRRGKRIAALGALLGAGWAAYGLSEAPHSRLTVFSRPRRLASTKAASEAARPVDIRFDLLKQRHRVSSLTPDVRHLFHIDLKSGQLLHVVIQQLGLDVRLEAFGPSNESLLIVDSSNSDRGPEPLLLVAERTGSYQIAVTTGGSAAKTGRYVLELAEVRTAQPHDRHQAAALQEYYQAKERLRKTRQIYSPDIAESFKDAAVALDESGSSYRLRADAWLDLGNAYAALNRWQDSVEAYRHADDLYRRLDDKGRQALALNEKGQGEEKLLLVDKSLNDYQRAVALAHAAGASPTEQQALVNLAQFHAERANAPEVDRYLQLAIPLARALHDQDGEAKALNARGKLYIRLGEYRKALDLYQLELKTLHLSPPLHALALRQIGDIYVSADEPEKSFQYYQCVLALLSQDGDSQGKASALVGLGYSYSKIGKFANALDVYQQAFRIFRLNKDLSNQANVFLNMGWTLGDLQRFEAAQDSFRQALLLSHSLKNSVLEAGALTGSAWIEQQRGNWAESQREAERALDLVETIRSDTEDKSQRLDFFAIKQSIYELLIGVLMKRYQDERDATFLYSAIDVSERSRARVLIDNLAHRTHRSFSQGRATFSVKEIQQHLPAADTALLEYSLGAQQSYLWWITPHEVVSFPLPPAAEIESLARELYESLVKSQMTGGRSQAIVKARALGKLLLGPVASRLGDKRLLVVASGALLSIPFGAFPDPRLPALDPDEESSWPEPLVVRNEIVNEPSASALLRLRAIPVNHQSDELRISLVADGVFSRSDDRVPLRFRRRRDDPAEPESYGRLPASRTEAESIAKLLSAGRARKFFGFEANRQLFMNGSLREEWVIHVATHSVVPPDHPEDAAIVLSQVDENGHQIEGLLGAKEIAALDLHASLVVLSSCQSARGANVPGEGVVGLPQAFLSAGAASVVTSLWDVDDRRTSQLMVHFYQHLLGKEGQSISGALRTAQVEMWKTKEWNAPWFWASFVAQGDWSFRSIALNKKPSRVSPQDGDPGSSGANQRNPSPRPRP